MFATAQQAKTFLVSQGYLDVHSQPGEPQVWARLEDPAVRCVVSRTEEGFAILPYPLAIDETAWLD